MNNAKNDDFLLHAYLAHRIRARCVDDGDCLCWTGALATNGIGPVLVRGGKNYSARRILWELKHQRPFPHGRVATPSCGNKACLGHVVSGTRKTVADLWRPRRSHEVASAKLAQYRRAEGRSKLSLQIVAEIRSSAERNGVLAERYGVHRNHISRVRNGKGWVDYSSPFRGLGSR